MEQNYKKNRKITVRRKMAAICIGIIMLFTFTGCADTASETQSHLDAKNGVVVVSEYVALDGVEAGVAHGSGFFIGTEGEDPQYLVTNHHVIADYLYFGAGQLAAYTDDDGTTYALKSYVRVYFDSRDYVEAYVVGYNEVADVALLRIASPTNKRRALKLCSPTGDMVGSTVYAIGFPGVADNPVVDSVTSWGLEDLTFTSGIISRLTTTSGTGVQNIQVDVTIGHGNSGGPIVNENGSAVGISAWGYMNENAEEAAYAVNIDEVITLLNLYGLPYTMENESGTTGSPAIIIGAGAGILILLVVVVVIVVLSKKKKKSAAASVLSPTVASGTDRAGSTPASASGASSSGDDTGYRLQGVTGTLEGRRFMIRKNTPLTFGRNAEVCNVAFPAATAGVSGKHCQVWYDNGTVWIKDLGSSHGTFFMTGKKLAAGQAMQIKPGERFSLGSDAETFVLVQKGGN